MAHGIVAIFGIRRVTRGQDAIRRGLDRRASVGHCAERETVMSARDSRILEMLIMTTYHGSDGWGQARTVLPPRTFHPANAHSGRDGAYGRRPPWSSRSSGAVEDSPSSFPRAGWRKVGRPRLGTAPGSASTAGRDCAGGSLHRRNEGTGESFGEPN